MDSSVVPVMTWYYSVLREGLRPSLPESVDVTPLLFGAAQFAVALLAALVLRGFWVWISELVALRSGSKRAALRSGRRANVAQFPSSEDEAPLGERPAA